MPQAVRNTRTPRKALRMEDILKELHDDNEQSECEDVNANSLPAKIDGKSDVEIENCFRTPKRKNKRKSKVATNGSERESEDEAGTPPKVNKFQTALFSPSHLISNLRIQDDPSDDEAGKKASPKHGLSKYGNARKVLNGTETDVLPGREAEIEELRAFLFDRLESDKSGSLYVSGQPGTGKTACLTHILRSEEVTSKFTKIYINCTGIATLGAIYKKICSELRLKTDGKTEKDALKAIDKYLSSKHKMLLMILDEVDQLTGRKQSILYEIFEWPSKPNSRLILVAIANQLDLTDRTLTRLNAKLNLKPKLMHFAPYSKDQLIAIFKSRLENAGVLDVFSTATLQLLSAKVAAVNGDVRRALDIGRRVAELAEQQQKKLRSKIDLDDLGLSPLPSDKGEKPSANSQNNNETVPIQLVVNVLKNVYGASQTLDADMEDTFPLQQKILICCLLLILNNDKNKDITIGRLHDVFKRVCTKRNLLAVDQAEFVGLCSLVETHGIIRVLSKKEPRLSKVVLQWDQDEVMSAVKDKQLMSAILEDTLCLKR